MRWRSAAARRSPQPSRARPRRRLRPTTRSIASAPTRCCASRCCRASCPISTRTLPPGPGPASPSTWPTTSPSCSTSSRSEEHTSELQSHSDLVCRLLLEKQKKKCYNLSHINRQHKHTHIKHDIILV